MKSVSALAAVFTSISGPVDNRRPGLPRGRYNFRPHDKANAKARRLRQIAKGQLKVEGITPDQAASRLLALVSKTRAA